MRRFCLALHTQGQVTTERLTDLLNGIGLAISKREVVRLLTTDLEPFEQEDRAILQAGLTSSPYITVDDTGARHARRPGVTTQIGGERFCVFRTSRSKSRLNFLSLLRAGCEDYVVNEAALDYLRGAVRRGRRDRPVDEAPGPRVPLADGMAGAVWRGARSTSSTGLCCRR